MANFVFKPLREGSIISSGEEAYDKKLLCSLRGVIPQHKLDTFEELNAQIELALTGRPRPALYSEKTAVEFHDLLLCLLDSFKTTLESLVEYRSKSDMGSTEFETQLTCVVAHGSALLSLVKGSGTSHHLQNLEPLLGDHRREAANEEDIDFPSTAGVGWDGQPQSQWQSYMSWLNLMVVYFGAADAIHNYVLKARDADSTKTISFKFKLLVSPYPDKGMVPWKDLLSKYLPDYVRAVASPVSDTALLSFLTTAAESSRMALAAVKSFKTIFTACKPLSEPPSKHRRDRVLRCITDLKQYQVTLPGWIDYIAELEEKINTLIPPESSKSKDLKKLQGKQSKKINNKKLMDKKVKDDSDPQKLRDDSLQDLKDNSPQKSKDASPPNLTDDTLDKSMIDSESLIKGVDKVIDLLMESAKFFNELMNSTHDFSGTQHCEISIATLMSCSLDSYGGELKVTLVIFILDAVRS